MCLELAHQAWRLTGSVARGLVCDIKRSVGTHKVTAVVLIVALDENVVRGLAFDRRSDTRRLACDINGSVTRGLTLQRSGAGGLACGKSKTRGLACDRNHTGGLASVKE